MYIIILKNTEKNLDFFDKIKVSIFKIHFYSQKSGGRTISFITLGDNAYGITLKGFAYPLDNYNLELGSTRCISNIVSEDEAEIELEIGKLIAILTNPEL